MSEGKNRELIVGAVFGIVGAVIGSIATGLVNAHVQREQQRMQVVMESFKADGGNQPVELLQIRQFVDEMRNLSFVSSGTISRLAEIQRKYPDCGGGELSDRCRPLFVETIGVMRDELGSGDASSKDIDQILSGKFLRAQQAFQHLKQK